MQKLLHFFIPRHSNNHKAKALHLSSLSLYLSLLIVFQIGLTLLGHANPQILSYASNISIGDLLSATNSRRSDNGKPTLSLDDQLSQAASGKAGDMFESQYWAHISPSGKQPWDFITGAGYNFIFAGENLARDFGDSNSVVDAWMNSPSHRDNLLSDRFHDIGFAVVNGKYGEDETTLVVQMFGTRAGATPTVAAPQVSAPPATAEAEAGPEATPPKPTGPTPGIILNLQNETPPPFRIDVLAVTRAVSLGLVVLLLGVMAVDSWIVYRQKVVRLSGHNLAHMLFLLVVLAALNLIGRTGITL